MRFGSRRDNGVQAATQFTLSLNKTNSASSVVPLDSKFIFFVICETGIASNNKILFEDGEYN
jgi:hypothetical protein